MDEEYVTAEEDFPPKLLIKPATDHFHGILPDETHNPRTVDDSLFSVGSHSSSGSSYQPTLSLAAMALDQGFMGTTRVSEGDEGFVNAYNMLTGIRTSVSTVCAKQRRDLEPKHYQECREFTFDATPKSDKGSKSAFKFKDYAPQVFREMREDTFGLDPADYLMSLTGKYIVSEITSPGKSGSFFYYSRDCRFIIKTIHHSEHRHLRQILQKYHQHVKKHPHTLISQFYGLHRVTLPFGRKIHFLVMNNVFPALYEVHSRWDLKGSTLGRSSKGSDKQFVVYKDLDWLEDDQKIVLGPRKRNLLIEQLEADVEMLKECNVMDYSLLIGTHDLDRGNKTLDAVLNLRDLKPQEDDYGNVSQREQEEFVNFQEMINNTDREVLKELDLADTFRTSFRFYREKGGLQSTNENNQPQNVIYYLGIIDFLTYYSARKRLETKGKGVLHHKEKNGISAIPAQEYGERFFKFIKDQIGPREHHPTEPHAAAPVN